MVEHVFFAVVIPQAFIPATVALHVIALVADEASERAEPRTSGIEHPPQLIG